MNEHSFKIHRIQGYIATLYLVEYNDGRLLLLDGGARRDAARLVNFIESELGSSPGRLRLALVTHMHCDHSGGAPRLRRDYGVRIAAHRDIDDWYGGFSGTVQHLLDTILGHYTVWRRSRHLERAWASRRLNPDIGLRDGQALPGFPDWRAYAAPGHTLYDMVFFAPEAGILYVGDLLLRFGERVVLPFPTIFPGLMAQSLERLARLPVRRLLLAHGGEFEIDDPEAFFLPLRDEAGRGPDGPLFRLVRPLLALNRAARRGRREKRAGESAGRD